MDGPKLVVDSIVARLAAALPPKLTELRIRTPVGHDVPNPYTVVGYEPESEGLDQLPAVYVTELESTLTGGSADDDGTLFTVDTDTYVFVIVGGFDQQSVVQARQMYTLAVREILMQRRDVGDVQILTRRYTESHSEIDRGDRGLVAAVRIRFTARTMELATPYLPPIGAGVDVSTRLLRHGSRPPANYPGR